MAPPDAPRDYHVTGVRIYSDGLSKDHKQSIISRLVAIVTLTLYTGWLHILFGLLVGCFFSSTPRYILGALLFTLWLPARPVLWPAFNRLWIFKTWREYFNYRCAAAACPRPRAGAPPAAHSHHAWRQWRSPRPPCTPPAPSQPPRNPPAPPRSFSFEEVLDKEKRYIFTEFPHGVYPLSPLIAGTLMQTLFDSFNIYRWVGGCGWWWGLRERGGGGRWGAAERRP
jgi:2-acylglycerol O-acyltransferase 2